MQITDVGRAPCSLLGPGECRQEQCGQNGDYGDYHQQFDEREGASDRQWRPFLKAISVGTTNADILNLSLPQRMSSLSRWLFP